MASRQTIRKGKRALAKAEIKTAVTIKGFHTVTLTLNNIKATTAILTEVFDYKQIEQEDNLYRYQTDAVENAASLDLLEMPQAQRGLNAGGTKVRLGDTELFIQIEKDYNSGHYGEESTFGGGKNVRDGMAQSSTKTRDQGVLDFVIINVVVIDHWGIVKGDVGIKDGKIVGIGKAGNPDTIDGVTENMIIDASTEVHSGAGHILTAGGIDTHVHFISPQQVDHALLSSVTTMIGGGSGPADGTSATLVTSGAWHIEKMIQATENFLMNVGFFGKGNCSTTAPLIEQIEAGALGLKVHEDWGATPAAIDASLTVADEYDIQVALHADSLNESGFLEDTVNAINGRTIHTFHTEGAGGGHAPDIMKIASHPDVLPSSTNPTRPFTVNTVDEH